MNFQQRYPECVPFLPHTILNELDSLTWSVGGLCESLIFLSSHTSHWNSDFTTQTSICSDHRTKIPLSRDICGDTLVPLNWYALAASSVFCIIPFCVKRFIPMLKSTAVRKEKRKIGAKFPATSMAQDVTSGVPSEKRRQQDTQLRNQGYHHVFRGALFVITAPRVSLLIFLDIRESLF